MLEVARRHGIPIPTLCTLKALGSNRSCRLCVVEAEGLSLAPTVLASCDLKASAGLVVRTATPQLQKIRQTILELLLAGLPENRDVQEIARKYNVESTPFENAGHDECVLCGICITACRAKLGVSALSFAAQGDNERKVAGFVQLDGSACIGCGACANLCPIGVIGFSDSRRQKRDVDLRENRQYPGSCFLRLLRQALHYRQSRRLSGYLSRRERARGAEGVLSRVRQGQLCAGAHC